MLPFVGCVSELLMQSSRTAGWSIQWITKVQQHIIELFGFPKTK
jgi:hypothetical protein